MKMEVYSLGYTMKLRKLFAFKYVNVGDFRAINRCGGQPPPYMGTPAPYFLTSFY